ncbi:MAG: hypothetical protein Q9213_000731 [Squamulea squamosa]
MAGQRTPPVFPIVPDQIRSMAAHLLGVCKNGNTHIGGFITGDLQGMTGWLTSPDAELDMAMRNYDPTMAYIFSQAEFEAAQKVPPGSRMAAKLRARGQRLLKAKKMMEPRGRRITWWSDPNNPPRMDKVEGVGDMGTDTATARKGRRRRRGGMGEESLMD